MHSELPDNVDAPYVPAHEFKVDNDNRQVTRLNIMLTTRRLLEVALKRPELLLCDATYKLIWQGYPVILVGTTDLSKTFHPIAVLVSKSEQAEDHQFLFSSLKTVIFKLFQVIYAPKVLLADAAHACTNGFQAVFSGDNKRIVCWAHVLRAYERLRRIRNEETRKSISRDIYNLQQSVSPSIFRKAIQLFDMKWRQQNQDTINEFLDYFAAEWCTERNCGKFRVIDG